METTVYICTTVTLYNYTVLCAYIVKPDNSHCSAIYHYIVYTLHKKIYVYTCYVSCEMKENPGPIYAPHPKSTYYMSQNEQDTWVPSLENWDGEYKDMYIHVSTLYFILFLKFGSPVRILCRCGGL